MPIINVFAKTMSDLNTTRPRAAAISMISGMAVIGLIDIYVIEIARNISLWQFLLVRGLMTVSLIFVGGRLLGAQLWPRNLGRVVFRSLLVATAMLFYFGSLAFMPLAQSLAGLYTSPVFVLLITAALLRERIGPMRIAAVGIGFAGIVMVLNPDWTALSIGTFIPVFGGFFYAAGAVATRRLCDGESTISLLMFLFGVQGLIGGIALVILGIVAPEVPLGADGFLLRPFTWDMWAAMPWVLMQVFGAALGVGLIIRAYQLGDTSYVAIYEYSVFIFGPVFAWLLMSQSMTLWQITGIALIAAAGSIITLRSTAQAS